MLKVFCIGNVGQLHGALQKACAARQITLDLVSHDVVRDADLSERITKSKPDFVLHYFRGTSFPLLTAVGECMPLFSSDDFWYAALCCKDVGVRYMPILPQPGTPCSISHGSPTKSLINLTELQAEAETVESVKSACLSEQGITAIESDWLFDERIDAVLGGLVSDLLQQQEIFVSGNVPGAPTPADHFASALVALMEQVKLGAHCENFYYYSSQDQVTEFEFAEAVSAIASQFAQLTANVISVDVDSIPLQSGLTSTEQSGLLNGFGIKPKSWRQGLVGKVKLLVESVQQQAVH